MNVQGIDYVEFYVEDGPQSAAELISGYGFASNGFTDAGSSLLRQADIKLRLTQASELDQAEPDHPGPRHRGVEFVRRHGDGLGVIALRCLDASATYAEAIMLGAANPSPDDLTIQGFGDVALRFVQTDDPPAEDNPQSHEGLLIEIDHVAICVPAGELSRAVDFCEQVLDFRQTYHEYIEIGEQAMNSTVVQNQAGTVTFTLLEPDVTKVPGQIDTFLNSHEGAGVQHVAFRTEDIAAAIRCLSNQGVEFLTTPSTYYDALEQRIGTPEIPVETLRELNVLVDRDHGGQLFQIFTRSAHARRTLFFELIERRGARTFGSSNIKALYEAVERQTATVNG